MSTNGGLWKALERAATIGCEACQIFAKNNVQWFGKPLSPDATARFDNSRRLSGIARVSAHAGYLINVAAPPSPKRAMSIRSLIDEVQLATSLDLPFTILHPGCHMGAGVKVGIRRAVAGVREVLAATRASPVRLVLENTSGQGSCLGHRIAELAEICHRLASPDRVGICLDTAHLFEAGYDIRSREGWDNVLEEVDELLGIDKVVAIHLNDSKTGLGSRVDRHAGIGQGRIGRDAFRHIVNEERFRDLPGCIETPKSADLQEDIKNLAILRRLRRQ